MIEYQNISITLGGRRILKDISVTIKSGEIFCIVGRSGVGKSVMIKQLVGLLKPDTGSIKFMGEEVTTMSELELMKIRKKCQMVFQQATLFDSMNCVDNVAVPIKKHLGLDSLRARQRALGFMVRLGVEHLAYRNPSDLGPGLKKLVAIAKSMTLNPEAILYDEPTTGLDPLAARKFDALVKNTLAKEGLTQVVVSHDIRSVFDIAERVAMLHKGELYFLGTVEELARSTDSVIRNFIKGQTQDM